MSSEAITKWEIQQAEKFVEQKRAELKKSPEAESKSLLVKAGSIEPKTANFLRAGIPDNNITVIAGDGGVGKSLFECELAAAISTGRICVLDPEPKNYEDATGYNAGKVLLFNMEDSFAHVVSRRLTDAGADMDMILTANPDADTLISIGDILSATREEMPQLVIIDPLQAFVPKGVAMERRNDMRRFLAPVQKCAEECNTAFLIVMHTNKRFGASGRDRLADSADMWDIARSVFVMGNTHDEDRTRYISHEKSSYCQPIHTTLCRIDSHGLYRIGETDKTDYDYVRERDKHRGGRPPAQRDEAKEIIRIALMQNGGRMDCKTLDSVRKQNGIAKNTFETARKEMLTQGEIRRASSGHGKTYQTDYELIE